IHLLEFEAFPFNCFLKVLRRTLDSSQGAQMGMGVDCLGMGRGPEKFGDLGEAVNLCLLGKGEIFAVGLAFSGKSLGEILFCCHRVSSCSWGRATRGRLASGLNYKARRTSVKIESVHWCGFCQ